MHKTVASIATMDLNRIASFLRVVDAGSFTAAAKALGLPKSSVSRSLRRLEEDIGVRLLHRTTRSLRATDAGRIFYERSRLAMAGLEEAVTAVGDLGSEPRGTVRVTSVPGAGSLAGILGRFMRRYPQVHVDL